LQIADYNGIDIHDRHFAFETFASKSINMLQYCWSHIICDGKELEELYGEEGAGIKRALQTVFKEAREYHGHGTMEDVEKFHRDLTFLLHSNYEHARCRKFVKNLLKRKREWLFQFVMNPHVEQTTEQRDVSGLQ